MYLDDSCWVVQGTLARRNLILAFIIYTMAALGLNISIQKGERGDCITWAGVEFRLKPGNELLVALPEKFLQDLQDKLQSWGASGMASLKDLRSVTGKISWLSGTLTRARWILRVFYAVLTAREHEVASGVEEQRRQTRKDSRSKEHLFPVKRLEGARLAMLEFLKVTKERPTKKINLGPKQTASVVITTDASPEGLGAVLLVNNQMVDVLHSKVSEIDAKDLGFELGSSSSQGILETLAILVAIDKWGGRFGGLPLELCIQSDSVTALSTTRKQSAAGPALNFLGACLGILLEKYHAESVLLRHLPGVANTEADYLSRSSTWATSNRPPSLEGKEFSGCRPRTGDFYPLPTPGRRPDLWGATSDDRAETGLSWL